MTLLSFISAFGTFLSIIIGSVTLRENNRSHQNRLFATLCFIVGYISFTEFGYRQAETSSMAYFWFKLSLITPILIPVMLHFILVFTQQKYSNLSRGLIIFNYSAACVFIFIDLLTGKISGKPAHSIYGWDHNLVAGAWYQFFTGWALFIYIFIIALISRYYFSLKPSADKIRARYTMYAFTIISTFAIITEKIFPFMEFEFPELSTFGFLIGNILIGYAMWKYRLLRISPVNAAENIVETMSDSLFLLDTNNLIVSVNTAAEVMLNALSGQLSNEHADSLFFDSTLKDEFHTVSMNWRKPIVDYTSQFKTIQGDPIPVSISSSILTDTTGDISGCVVITRNISERLAAQRELENFKIKRLESISMLAGGIANDFESVLNSITNNLLLVKLHSTQTSDTVGLINRTEEMAIEAQNLTKKLLSLSGNNNTNEPELIESVREMINSSIGFMITDSSIDYEVSFDDDLMNIRIRKSDFQTILLNLVTNAQEAVSENGFISIDACNLHIDSHTNLQSVTAQHPQLAPGWYVKVTINDNGYGINSEIRDKVFDPFFSTKKEKQGLGLSVAHSIVRKKGGAIFFEPHTSEGCSISFLLPSTDLCTTDQLAFSPNDLLIEENNYVSGKLLLIENDLAIRSQITGVLSDAGFDVVDTNEISSGIHYFNEAMNEIPFDSILCCDSFIGNPDMLNFISRMKVLKQQLKIIVIKKHNGSAVVQNIPRTYFESVIPTPVHCKKLLTTIKTVICSN